MVSAVSSYATKGIVIDGENKKQTVSGKLAGSYQPGTCVYESATGTWTAATGNTNSNYNRLGWVDNKFRTSSTFGEVDIDATYTNGTAINVEIVVGPRGDMDFILCAFCKDPGAAKYFGTALIGESSGKVELHSSHTSKSVVAIVSKYGLPNGDTVVRLTPV